jgi:hypothetical protein
MDIGDKERSGKGSSAALVGRRAKHCRNCLLPARIDCTVALVQARSSVGLERFLDTEEVDGSNPFGPTIVFQKY